MSLDITERGLLAGTGAYRRIHPELKDRHLAKLRELRRANATIGEPDIMFLLEVFGDVLDQEVSRFTDWHELLTCRASPIGRDELGFWFDQCAYPSSIRTKLFGMFNDGVIQIFCQWDQRHLLVCDAGIAEVAPWDYLVYPADKSTDHLAEDEAVDSEREYDFAGSVSVLSALLAEWSFGRPNSMEARDYICSVCEMTFGAIT
jgi:hypothetical protein